MTERTLPSAIRQKAKPDQVIDQEATDGFGARGRIVFAGDELIQRGEQRKVSADADHQAPAGGLGPATFLFLVSPNLLRHE